MKPKYVKFAKKDFICNLYYAILSKKTLVFKNKNVRDVWGQFAQIAQNKKTLYRINFCP